ncbi:MAG TPA: response regulator transcription factor [Alphaproteobacteria bacterium]
MTQSATTKNEPLNALHAPHVLVVDDDKGIRDLTGRYLQQQGCVVLTAQDAADARAKIGYFAFDVVVLDVMMPRETGFSLATSWRTQNMDTPIIFLTAKGEAEDRIAGLETGADDYMVKPFEPKELLLRIQSLIRRTRKNNAEILQFGRWQWDATRQLLVDGAESISLSNVESNLLSVLIAHIGQPINRYDLAAQLGLDGNERTIDVQVARLRQKIEPDVKRPRYIQTVRGEGYVLRPDTPGAA